MIAVYGAGGFAHQILDLVEALARSGTAICFVDDSRAGEAFYGIAVRSLEEAADAAFVIAISDPGRRREIAASLGRFTSLIAPTARISPHAEIGEGAILCHNMLVEPGVRIGRHFHGNIYSYVAHESQIGDFVTFAPRVNCNGRVQIHDGAYIGTGACLKQGVTIGRDASVGMGSVVIADVPDGATVVGNPARIVRRR